MEQQGEMIVIASFDVGKVNLAYYVEAVSRCELAKLEQAYSSLDRKYQRRVRGHMNKDMKKILRGVCLCGERLETRVLDIRADKTSARLDIPTRKNLIEFLQSKVELWKYCDYIIIEQQYFNTFGKRKGGGGANVDAIKVGECILTWFLDNFPFANIQYFSSSYKTQMLGAPDGLKKAERKKWATEKTEEIYIDREDYYMNMIFDLAARIKRKRLNTEERIMSYLRDFEDYPEDIYHLANKLVRERQKLDDIADACLQCQAFKFRTFVGTF